VLHLPDSLVELGKDDSTSEHNNSVIVMCHKLKEINIPPGVTELGWRELSMNYSLEELYIPPTVTKIGDRAFSACPALTLHVYEGTAAHAYAVENNIPFLLLSKIIAAHAGTGKSTLAAKNPDKFIDLEAMPYKYILPATHQEEHEENKANPDLEFHPDWPYNYVSAIKDTMKSGKTLLIPPVWHVLTQLQENGIPYTIAYPRGSLKDEYRARYEARGNTKNFMSYFIDHWDNIILAFEHDKYGTQLVLESGEYLSDHVLP
jgi:hypothetical protein